jgi:hypothetical protein
MFIGVKNEAEGRDLKGTVGSLNVLTNYLKRRPLYNMCSKKPAKMLDNRAYLISCKNKIDSNFMVRY